MCRVISGRISSGGELPNAVGDFLEGGREHFIDVVFSEVVALAEVLPADDPFDDTHRAEDGVI